MKLLFALMLVIFSGCATVSEFDQGCREGKKQTIINYQLDETYKTVNEECDKLDAEHKAQMRKDHPGMKGY